MPLVINKQTKQLVLAFLLLSFLAILFFYRRFDQESTSRQQQVSADFAAQWTHIRSIEKIEDANQRCLDYPDPPWLHWDRNLVIAFCRPLSYKFISRDEIAAAIEAKQPEIVERAFTSYFEESVSNSEKRGLLTRTYRVLFEDPSPEAAQLAERWVQAQPQSPFALTARGLQHVAAASEARGSDTIRNTADTSLQDMTHLLVAARSDLETALSKNSRLIPAYHGLIVAARYVGDHEYADAAVKAALNVDPADDRIFLDWMAAKEPRWGGSKTAMLSIAQLAERQLSHNPLLQLVLEKPASYLAIELDIHDQSNDAVKAFDTALAIAPSGADLLAAGGAAESAGMSERAIWYFSESYRFFGGMNSYIRRATSLANLGRSDLAHELVVDAKRQKARDIETMYTIGGVLWRLHEPQEAEKTYAAMLERRPNDREALTALSTLYLSKLHQPEKAQPLISRLIDEYPSYARGWLLKSVGKTDDECHQALRKYMDFVDKNDPNEKDDIVRVQARLKELESSI